MSVYNGYLMTKNFFLLRSDNRIIRINNGNRLRFIDVSQKLLRRRLRKAKDLKMAETFPIQLLFQGKTVVLEVTIDTTGIGLLSLAQATFEISDDTSLKLLYNGKQHDGNLPVFSVPPKKIPKILVLATKSSEVLELNLKRSDPTLRGFDNEIKPTYYTNKIWGEQTSQDKTYKFGRFQACTWHSFGHRPTESTPHAFGAMALLEKLATDPGVVAIMKERELFVNTLGEMDPIDDRLMQKKQTQGACLLGYNTNRGLRIDIKLRTDDLRAFRSYPQLVATLIHELSHNWVGEHNILFWTNHGQMRVEYLHRHSLLTASGYIVNGRTTAQIAEVPYLTTEGIFQQVIKELQQDMTQHGLHPRMIEAAIRQRCEDLKIVAGTDRILGRGDGTIIQGNARELALAAAERRARQQEQHKDK